MNKAQRCGRLPTPQADRRRGGVAVGRVYAPSQSSSVFPLTTARPSPDGARTAPTTRMRTPVASKIALAIAAATGRIEGSPAPVGQTLHKLISTTSIISGFSNIEDRVGRTESNTGRHSNDRDRLPFPDGTAPPCTMLPSMVLVDHPVDDLTATSAARLRRRSCRCYDQRQPRQRSPRWFRCAARQPCRKRGRCCSSSRGEGRSPSQFLPPPP